MGRIYDVLNDLDEAKLVRSQNAGQPTRYAPVDPRTNLSKLLEVPPFVGQFQGFLLRVRQRGLVAVSTGVSTWSTVSVIA